ncbi:MAG: hypothetical protein FD189_2130 [Elusimicrobia bacterium]|nr:MAG: hypothetical protein FD154_2187 [Elusimicrobiota bacterium]KAF0154014.1 MAG: hypothetical protein FD189_2130 [Elusimicrobiota bacterium]
MKKHLKPGAFLPGLARILALSVFLAAPAAAFDGTHAPYAGVLKAHLRGGLVDYKALKAAPAELDAYLAALAAVKPAEYEAWARADKTAFWLNAYNAYTIKAILDHYPIKPNWRASLRYPGNSIRQIPGVWDKLNFKVMGRELTLDGMEHDILRKEFNEPRAHMALVCASLGCPVLRPQPYTGAALDAQLDDQTRRFLADPAKFRLDKEKGVAWFSPIFKWFAQDFRPSAAAFMARHVSAEDRAFLEAGKFKAKWLDYDWALNEITDGGKK